MGVFGWETLRRMAGNFDFRPTRQHTLSPTIDASRLYHVQVMACSNNVVRAALTPKFRDVDLLVEMLTYNMGAPAVLPAETVDQCRKRYTPPINDFELQVLEVGP